MSLHLRSKLWGQRKLAMARPCVLEAECADSLYTFTLRAAPGIDIRCCLTVDLGLDPGPMAGHPHWVLALSISGKLLRDWTRKEHMGATRMMEKVLLGIGMPGDDHYETGHLARLVRRFCTSRELAQIDRPAARPIDGRAAPA